MHFSNNQVNTFLITFYLQLPSSNCSYKDLNYTLVVENKRGDVLAEVDTFPSLDSDVIKENLAVDLIENKEYFVQIQITVHSQTIASQKYIFSKLLAKAMPCQINFLFNWHSGEQNQYYYDYVQLTR